MAQVILTADAHYVFRSEDNVIAAQWVDFGEFDNMTGIEVVTSRGTYLFKRYSDGRYMSYVKIAGKSCQAFITAKGDTLELAW